MLSFEDENERQKVQVDQAARLGEDTMRLLYQTAEARLMGEGQPSALHLKYEEEIWTLRAEAEQRPLKRREVDNMLSELVALRKRELDLEDVNAILREAERRLQGELEKRPLRHAPVADVPEELYLGITKGEWPIHVWASATHAMTWVSANPTQKRLYRIAVDVLSNVRYLPPGEARLAEEPIRLREGN